MDWLKKSQRGLSNRQIQTNIKDKLSICQQGIKEGFFNDDNRVQAYMIMLDIKKDDNIHELDMDIEYLKGELENIKYKNVILADVHRSINMNNIIKKEEENIKKIHRQSLLKFLIVYFIRNKQDQYFQGFNSIAEIFVLYFQESIGYQIFEKFSQLFLKQFLQEEIMDTVEPQYKFVSGYVKELLGCQIEYLDYGIHLGDIIGFYSHSNRNKDITFRIWDFLISLKIREQILNIKNDTSNMEYVQTNMIIKFCTNLNIEKRPLTCMDFKKFKIDDFTYEQLEEILRDSYELSKQNLKSKFQLILKVNNEIAGIFTNF